MNPFTAIIDWMDTYLDVEAVGPAAAFIAVGLCVVVGYITSH